MADNEKYAELFRAMNAEGLTLDGMIQYDVSKARSMLGMSDDSKEVFCHNYEKLFENTSNTKSKGNILERLAASLMYSESNLFQVYKNCRTSTNEIDLLLGLTDKGKYVIPKLYGFLGETILCECKNHSQKLGVTYVGKFYSLLKLSKCKFGMIFSIYGITGTSKWSDGMGLIRKIALKDDIYIIDFTFDEYTMIKNGDRLFWDLVEQKYHELKCDVDLEHWISQHEAERMFIQTDSND